MKTICYQPATEGDQTGWRRLVAPSCLKDDEGTLLVAPPPGCCAQVNGLDVVGGFQVVDEGDLVRIVQGGQAEVTYVVGRTLPVPEPGGGRLCQFTGRPLDGQAIRCSCKSLFTLEVAEQLGSCPCCGRPLNDKEEPPPEETL